MIDLSIQKTLDSSHGKMSLSIELQIARGTFTAIQGKSGAGKTSLLRMIAGLMQPDSGKIEVLKETWFDSKGRINLKIQKRRIGYVFQDYALFPNMTVFENLKFPLKKTDDNQVLSDLIEVMELGDLQNAKPNRLSGGQKQRVALARALVQKPQLLLLDEPLSALDTEIRQKLQTYILKIHREFNLTTLMVTHDTAETLKMADQLVILDQGKVVNKGTPTDVLTNKSLSGKFQFSGEIITIEQQDVISIISVLVGNQLVKVVSDLDDTSNLNIGDKVLVASKAFNPIIQKLD